MTELPFKTFLRRIVLVAMLTSVFVNFAAAQDRKNVLFIAVDDLRPELGCYGKQYMTTPNIDALASRGVLFESAYCMVPTCGASRAAVMSGRRPAPTRFRNYLTWLSKEVPDAMPLHAQFKNDGYTAISIGKIFHHMDDHADDWSEPPVRHQRIRYFNEPARQASIAEHKRKYPNSNRERRGPASESADVADEEYGDGQSATVAIEKLEQFSKNPEQPFFLAVGFNKPHLPFIAPKKYWDMYDRSEIKIAENHQTPDDVPKVALHQSGELRAYSDIPPRGPMDESKAIDLIHGYRASISFIDAQIGRIIETLDRTGLAEDTIIVLWSDHGWQLGEHGLWNKHSCFETSMWTPLIISVPGDDAIKAGQRATGIVELIDLYPTICELSGVAAPENLDGNSLVPALQDPAVELKPYAIGRYQFGDTIRTKDFRYTEFRGKAGGSSGKGPVGMGKIMGRMMFSHASDPNENENVANKDRFQDAMQQLSAELNANKGQPYEK
ncbi:sulfatase [Mariniblastus fucicola]|uniref:Arylsulfatase n=1 Tax=Mariniblastus fucicola TaxID=980251 RepID=A0A5B9PKM1_9BACT|nr:sulfatase [Mariniblastus fucicola]QEG22943.1 Arylsulfatase [Mariniblastus fucicola]